MEDLYWYLKSFCLIGFLNIDIVLIGTTGHSSLWFSRVAIFPFQSMTNLRQYYRMVA